MRTTRLSVHNNQRVELFTRRRAGRAYELWVVISAGNSRLVHDHYFTHDDLEGSLAYARRGDLMWRDAAPAELPRRVGSTGVVVGKAIPKGKIIDFESPRYHLLSAIGGLPIDRRALAAARRTIVGTWSDGPAVACLEPHSALRLSCDATRHPFSITPPCPAPDRWRLQRWQLHMMNAAHGCGLRVAVIQVDDAELHVAAAPTGGLVDRQRKLVHVFKRRSDGVCAAPEARRRTNS
jgi:hypothetical protein